MMTDVDKKPTCPITAGCEVCDTDLSLLANPTPDLHPLEDALQLPEVRSRPTSKFTLQINPKSDEMQPKVTIKSSASHIRSTNLTQAATRPNS